MSFSNHKKDTKRGKLASALKDFHPLDTGLEQPVWELCQEYGGRIPERKICTREQFLALLAGVPPLRKMPGIPDPAERGEDYYTTLPRCASEEDSAACRAHLEETFGITDKTSLLAVFLRRGR